MAKVLIFLLYFYSNNSLTIKRVLLFIEIGNLIFPAMNDPAAGFEKLGSI